MIFCKLPFRAYGAIKQLKLNDLLTLEISIKANKVPSIK